MCRNMFKVQLANRNGKLYSFNTIMKYKHVEINIAFWSLDDRWSCSYDRQVFYVLFSKIKPLAKNELMTVTKDA